MDEKRNNDSLDKELDLFLNDNSDVVQSNNNIEVKNQNIRKNSEPKKSKRKRIISGVMSVIILVLAFILGYVIAYYNGDENSALARWTVNELNENAILCKENITSYDLMTKGMDGVMNDPYDKLMTPEETQKLYEIYEGKNIAIGMTVANIESIDGVIVVNVVKGSFAEQAGVKELYKLKVVNGVDVSSMELAQITEVIVGIPDETDFVVTFVLPIVEGTLLSYDDTKTIDITLKRTEFIERVSEYFDNKNELYKDVFDDNTAYIDLDSFVGQTAEQFNLCIQQFKDNGKKNLILDLRDNGGGADYNLKAVASYLLKDGDNKNPLILREIYKDESDRKLFSDDCKYDDYGFENLIVLINENTASASEALLLAMIDYNTVDLIVGNKTFGKGTGLVTKTMPQTGYSIRYTASYYYSPKGNTCEAVGIEPTAGYMLDNTPSYPYNPLKDSQLLRAVNALK